MPDLTVNKYFVLMQQESFRIDLKILTAFLKANCVITFGWLSSVSWILDRSQCALWLAGLLNLSLK
jgi:hypothetical protein